MKKLFPKAGAVALCSLFVVSCGLSKLTTNSVAYQSFRTVHAQPTSESPIPDEAKIAVSISFDIDGNIYVTVHNRTSEIMTIDQTRSFFVNSSGESTSYYDPTVRTTSVTDMSSSTNGASVNLGAVARVLGIGGPIGALASGINVGGSGTSGTSTTQMTYFSDMPRVSLGPHGSGQMSKVFKDRMIGKTLLGGNTARNYVEIPQDKSYCNIKICISYSLDGEKTFDTITTDIYANSWIESPVHSHGRVNDSLREVLLSKPDALNEYCYFLYFDSQIGSTIKGGSMVDYK